MASVFSDAKGNTKLQFTDVAGNRRTMSLGKMSEKSAAAIGDKIEKLVTAAIGEQPVDRSVARWLSELTPRLHSKFVKAGLLEPKGGTDAASEPTVAKFADQFIGGRPEVKERTLANYKQTRNKLVEYFGERRLLTSVTLLDADQWRSWLKGTKNLKENSVRSLVKNAKCMFGAAVRGRLLEANPFAGQKTKVMSVKERMKFIDHDAIAAILKLCPSLEWKAVVVLARYAGLRTPSETWSLRWEDVDFDGGTMRVKSPKLEHLDNGGWRTMPLSPEVRNVLEQLYMEPEGGEFVINRLRRGDDQNLRTTFCKLIRRAGLEVWTRPFQNLRSSRATELTRMYPSHVVCRWLGHDAKTAEAHYWQDRPEDLQRAASEPTAKALHLALHTGDESGRTNKKSRQKTAGIHGEPMFRVPPRGDEQVDVSAESVRESQFLGDADGAKSGAAEQCPDLHRIAAAWPLLPVEVREQILRMVNDNVPVKLA